MVREERIQCQSDPQQLPGESNVQPSDLLCVRSGHGESRRSKWKHRRTCHTRRGAGRCCNQKDQEEEVSMSKWSCELMEVKSVIRCPVPPEFLLNYSHYAGGRRRRTTAALTWWLKRMTSSPVSHPQSNCSPRSLLPTGTAYQAERSSWGGHVSGTALSELSNEFILLDPPQMKGVSY